jgi:hypothetical protein
MMGKLFKWKRGSTLDEQLADFEERKTDAQQAVKDAEVRCDEHLLAGGSLDDEDGKLATQAVHIAKIQESRFEPVITRLKTQIAEAEQKLANEHENIKRGKAEKELRTKAETLSVVLGRFRSASADIVPALEAVIVAVPLSNLDFPPQLRALLSSVAETIEERIAAARAHATSIVDRSAAVPRPAEPVTVEPKPDVPRKTCFLLDNSKWPDIDGVRTAGRHREVSLPLNVAEAALRYGHACEVASDRAMKLQHWRSPDFCVHHESICTWIDRPAPAVEPQRYDGHPQTSPIGEPTIGQTGVASVA